MLLSLVLAVIFAVVAVFFANDNQAAVQIAFFGLPLQGKLGTMVVLAFGIGAVSGIAVMLPAYLAKTWALLRSRRKMEDLERAAQAPQPTDLKQV
jgi:uncharacterized membrane protein YciS (DUF1049 family)